MKRLIECVPNFSEGRDPAKVDAIVHAMQSVPGVYVLDREMDADHNRSVITLAGEPEAVGEGAILGAGRALELIDMNHHTGAHPRVGATDVVPFIPVDGVTIEDCVSLARRVGNEIWKRYRIPIFFYEAAATRADRVNLGRARLSGVRAGGVVLRASNLEKCDLREAFLERADLSSANLEKCDLRDARLSEAVLIGANVEAMRCPHVPVRLCAVPAPAASLRMAT